MAILNYPTAFITPQRGSFEIITNTRTFRSPLSGTEQTAETPGVRWAAESSYTALNDDQAREMMAFIVQLRGPANRVFYGDQFHQTPRGTPTGTPLIKGASQVGSSLLTDGWTPSTLIFKFGDYIQLANNEYKLIISDTTSDVSGNATLNFEPVLRNAPADNSPITVTNAKAVMRLVDDKQAKWSYGQIDAAAITLKFVESFT